MTVTSDRVLTLVALFVIAPIGAAVVISVLLLFGVTPRVVFLPGFLVRTNLATLGFHAPNAVGVLVTVIAWWVMFVVVWLVVRRVWRRG